MGNVTGIELGPDSCVFVQVQPGRGALNLSSAWIVDASEWPKQEAPAIELCRRLRHELHLSRTAHVVAWGMPDGAPISDAEAQSKLRTVLAAGFRVASAISPAEALVQLSLTRPRGGSENATAWLALNVRGAAIAVVRKGELLYSRTFEWAYRGGPPGPNAQLLQRYSLVAELAPEVRRGAQIVLDKHKVVVDAAVTCGDLPELRSLTMPLIEELDLEVETLDSTEGWNVVGRARNERIAENAPALRLACAAATSPAAGVPPAPSGARAVPPWVMGGAAAAVLAAVAWWGVTEWSGARAVSETPRAQVAQSTQPAPAPAPVAAAGPEPASPPRTVPGPASPTAPAVTPSRSPERAPVEAAPGRHPSTSTRASKPERRSPAPRTEASRPPPTPEPRKRPDPPSSTSETKRPAASPATAGAAGPVPLNAPIPAVELIMVSSDRRVAVVNGVTVGVGDRVGRRVVARIEPNWIVLREPSGLEIQVPLRRR